MKQFEHKYHHITTLNSVVTALVLGLMVLATKQALADEPAPTASSTDSSTVEPTLVADPPTLVADPSDQPEPSGPPPSTEDLQARLNSVQQRLNNIDTAELDEIPLLLPNISSNVPTAYGASQGMVGIGVGYQERLRYGTRGDGTAAAVIGLGDPRKLGADVQVSFLDLSRFGHRLALGFKLHRQLSNDYTIAVGGENSLVSSYSDSAASYYGVISKRIRLSENSSDPFSRLYLSLGVGNGRFLSEDDVFNGRGGINVFGSAAVNINRSSMAFAEWNGQSLDVGASIVPFRKHPFAVTLALADVAGSGGDGTRFTVGLGYIFSR